MATLNNVIETLKEAKVNYYNTGIISITHPQYNDIIRQLIEAKETIEGLQKKEEVLKNLIDKLVEEGQAQARKAKAKKAQAKKAQAEEAKRQEIKKVFSELSKLQFEDQEGKPSSKYQSLDKEENQLNELAVKFLNEEDNAAANALLNEMREIIKAATLLVMGGKVK
tara:strand:- start:1209 stop:1709 length:501 start_codon:yes stop_codon:yes gene_type:complete